MIVISDSFSHDGIKRVELLIGLNEIISFAEIAYETIAFTAVALPEHWGPFGK